MGSYCGIITDEGINTKFISNTIFFVYVRSTRKVPFSTKEPPARPMHAGMVTPQVSLSQIS